MKALQAQREQEKEEFQGLQGSFDELSARHKRDMKALQALDPLN